MIVTPLEFFYARRKQLLDQMTEGENSSFQSGGDDGAEVRGITDKPDALNAEALALYERLIADFEGRANCS